MKTPVTARSIRRQLRSIDLPDRSDLPDIPDFAALPGVATISDIDLPAIDDVTAAVSDGLSQAGRVTTRVGRRAVRGGLRSGAAGARAAGSAGRTSVRVARRGVGKSVTLVREDPRRAVGIVAVVVAVIAAIAIIRRKRSATDESLPHLSAVTNVA